MLIVPSASRFTRRLSQVVFFATALLVVDCGYVLAAERPLPVVPAESVGLNSNRLAEIGGVVRAALDEQQMPGCVVLIGRQGKIAYWEAFGNRRVEPAVEPMTKDTLFDLASLTKPMVTATSVMILADRRQIELDRPAAEYLPEFGENGKQEITLLQLLTHVSGLTPDNALADYQQGPEQSWEKICRLKLLAPPGQKFMYSDVGFIVLGKLVERVSGRPLNEFAAQHIFQPIGMNETGYLPAESLRPRAAPTERREGRWMQGEVHDPRAYLMGGVAGHAGLFSTAEDLAVYAQAMAAKGRHGEVQVISEPTWDRMISSVDVGNGQRALGWDRRTGYSINRGAGMSANAFGHGGFTGTAIWIDPKQEMFVIFLSNRVHPNGKGSVNRLAGRIGTIAIEALTGAGADSR